MNVAFLNDTSAWYHWGCTGTSTVIREEVERRGHTVTSIPIPLLHGCKNLPQTLADFDNSEFLKTFFKENIEVAKSILECDIVLVNGEGSLHHLKPLSITILYLAYAAKKFCGKNVQIINHSCYPEGDMVNPKSHAAMLYRGVYKVMDFVAIREHRSLEIMKQLGIDATLSFDCLPLYIKHYKLPPAPRTKSIVVTGSVELKVRGIMALEKYIKKMADEGYAITVLTGAKDHPARNDMMFVHALKKAAPDGWTHLDAPSMKAWLSAIQGASLLLSGRFHYSIAACMLDTPAVILESNTPKNAALAEMANLPLPESYKADNLEQLLYERTEAALGHPPISDATKCEWQARAEKNFSGLPAC